MISAARIQRSDPRSLIWYARSRRKERDWPFKVRDDHARRPYTAFYVIGQIRSTIDPDTSALCASQVGCGAVARKRCGDVRLATSRCADRVRKVGPVTVAPALATPRIAASPPGLPCRTTTGLIPVSKGHRPCASITIGMPIST